MKIIGFTCTYNEAEMVPYVMPYVEAFGYDKFVVYDNQSTDNTVELLKQYPFVEVRTYDSGGKFDETKKASLQRDSFLECGALAKVGSADEELIWMTWTDFDEVFLINSDADFNFRETLRGDYVNRKYNCFYKNMINILPPPNDENYLKEVRDGKFMAHSYPGTRANVWVGGMKPTMFVVNDISLAYFHEGNHFMQVKMRSGRHLKSYDDTCRLYGFHLKYIDKDLLKKKWLSYSEKGSTDYGERAERIDEVYGKLYGLSFPIENYFLQDYFESALHKKTVPVSGLIEV